MIYIRIKERRNQSTTKYFVSIMILIITFVSGCYYDNEATLYPGSCDTVNITYSQYVRPFVDAGCSCHVAGSTNGNVNLQTYNDLKTYVTNGTFMKSIKHESGVSPMPPSVAKRSVCEISKLEAWISAGAIQN